MRDLAVSEAADSLSMKHGYVTDCEDAPELVE